MPTIREATPEEWRGVVRDINGNQIGYWGFSDDSAGPSKTSAGSIGLEG